MNWYPFQGSIQPIYKEVLRHLSHQGHEIAILTSIPYFLNGRVESWSEYRRKFLIKESWEGIKVVRTFVLSPRFLKRFRLGIRFLNFISFIVTSLIAAFFIKRPDVILAVSHPPLFMGLNSYIISRIKKCKYVYCLQDIYPDILYDLKILKKGLIFNALKRLEQFVYDKAAKISVLTSAMADNLRNKSVSSEKVLVIPHFSSTPEISPLSKINRFSSENSLDSKFVVLLPGSISYRYGIETIFEAAKLVSDKTNVRFIFIDRGEFRQELKQKVKSENVRNIQFLPFQPAEMFPYLLASADICIVSLDQGFASYSLPSKLYNIMGSSRPVVAITDHKSEVARIIKAADCGVVIRPDEPGLLAEKIQELASDPEKCQGMGRKGHEYAQRYFNKDNICRKYGTLIRETAALKYNKSQ